MPRSYPALTLQRVPAGAGFCAPEQVLSERVPIDGPAADVMTDLARVSAILTRPTDSIDEALKRT